MSVPKRETQFSCPVRVYYEDTDAGGVVYYANYLKFMERARTEWLRTLGFEQDALREREGLLFVVSRISLDYQRPARLDDLLDIGVELAQAGAASLVFSQDVMRRADGALCCRGQARIACVDARTLKPKRIPDKLMAEIADVL